MTRVTADRTVPAPPSTVRSVIEGDVTGFLRASGFDSVSRTGDRIQVSRGLGLATISLVVELDHEADVVLAFDAVEGIFERMRTEYDVAVVETGTRISATTEFTLGGIFGPALDETLVSMQRRREFEDQLDSLEERVGAQTNGR